MLQLSAQEDKKLKCPLRVSGRWHLYLPQLPSRYVDASAHLVAH
jgi:hypothetical protein